MNADYTCSMARLASHDGRVVEPWLAWDEWVLAVVEVGDVEPMASSYCGLRVVHGRPVCRWKCIECGQDADLTDEGYCLACSAGGFEGGPEPVLKALERKLAWHTGMGS